MQFSNFTPQPLRTSHESRVSDHCSRDFGDIYGVGNADSAQAAAFRRATSQVFANYQSLPDNPGPGSRQLAICKLTILTRIDPITTIPKRIQGLLPIAENLPWQPLIRLKQSWPRRLFRSPCIRHCAIFRKNIFLPGVENIPANSVGLLQSNQAFIEAYMVGLNSEMGRDLLWFGYPTDQRGSYFRQFWDVSAYVPQPGDPTDPTQLAEYLKDIPPINTWQINPSVGQHPNRPISCRIIWCCWCAESFSSATQTRSFTPEKPRLGPESHTSPRRNRRTISIFRGTLSPDITFLGFNITAADARGGTNNSPDGYFFVFQEQPSEPRFGLEPTPGYFSRAALGRPGMDQFYSCGRNAAETSARDLWIFSRRRSWPLARGGKRRRYSQTYCRARRCPDFLAPTLQPTGTAIVSDSEQPERHQQSMGSEQRADCLHLVAPPVPHFDARGFDAAAIMTTHPNRSSRNRRPAGNPRASPRRLRCCCCRSTSRPAS